MNAHLKGAPRKEIAPSDLEYAVCFSKYLYRNNEPNGSLKLITIFYLITIKIHINFLYRQTGCDITVNRVRMFSFAIIIIWMIFCCIAFHTMMTTF